jgi:hypothetical protein
MKMRFKCLIGCSLLVSVLALYGQDATKPQTAQTQSPDERRQIHSKEVHGGIPGQITLQLEKTSGDIELRWTQGPPLIVELDPLSTLEMLTCQNDLVVLGTIGNGTSQPTVDEGYIYTDWNLTIQEVLKNNQKSPVQVGQTIVVTRPGGTLEIGGRHVYARTDSPQFLSGAEVLLYLRYLPITGTYSLSAPNGVIFSGSKRTDLDRARFAQFGAMQKNDVLDLARKVTTEKCPSGGQP